MHFKMIIALVEDEITEEVLDATREAGATGATIISNVRGEGLNVKKGFFGLSLDAQRDLVMFIVEEHMSRHILETIQKSIRHENGTRGIAFQIDVEDVVGVAAQINQLQEKVEEEIWKKLP